MTPLNIFPITLGKDIIKIDDDERNKLINEIKYENTKIKFKQNFLCMDW